jgi:hypothetical protein
MTRISSKMTRFYKYAFPLIWLGILAFIVAVVVGDGAAAKDPIALIVPCVMALVGTLVFKRLVWNLVDLVLDGGDYLLVKNRGLEERIPLANIMNISASTNTNPPRITMRLVNPGLLGSEIAFSPIKPFSINPFARNAIADDLILRVHNAKSRRAP